MEETPNNSSFDQNAEHVRRLEEIDRDQRERESSAGEEQSAFAESIVEALDGNGQNPIPPLLDQEEIEENLNDEFPPRVNLTAVICTLIVAVCATIILCVAKPWKESAGNEPVQVAKVDESEAEKAKQEAAAAEQARIAAEQKAAAERQAAEEKARAEEQQRIEQQRIEQQKRDEEAKKQDNTTTLPIVKTTGTGTSNKYNNVRLVNLSTRKLTKEEVAQMTPEEMALSRNAVYVRHGYQFNNPELKEFFSKQSWFKPTDIKLNDVVFTEIEQANINLVKAREESLTPKK